MKNEITVENQEELDLIPLDFRGRIYIKFGTIRNPAVISNKYYYHVVAWENSSVEAWGNSSVAARENSSVVARGNSSVVAWENSSVEAWGNSSVAARENSSVVAWENSSVEAWENSRVEAWENSRVEAWDNSSVVASANAQIVNNLGIRGKIKISGNARIVYNPKNINDFIDFYGISHTNTKGTFYKAVKLVDGIYTSSYDDSFTYQVGKTIKEKCDTNTDRDCSYGIHISHLDWALRFGSDWENLAILEVEVKIKDIILPKNSNGKVRTSECKILREVPLNECGVFGKILAKRLSK